MKIRNLKNGLFEVTENEIKFICKFEEIFKRMAEIKGVKYAM